MEIGNEIGQKIRSAIKAKLVDLGAYVDDELPDYIMVMVANKKTEAQMADDLSLFLSANTSRFTSWLHGLLEKLQSITNETGSGMSQDHTSTKQKSTSVDTVINSAGGSSVAMTTGGGAGGGTSVVEQMVPSGDSAGSETRVTGACSVKLGRTMMSSMASSTATKVKLDDEPVIRLRPEHDEFENEMIETKEQSAATAVTSRPLKTVPALSLRESRKVSAATTFDSVLTGRKRQRLAQDDDEEYVPLPMKTGRVDAKLRLGLVTSGSSNTSKLLSSISGGKSSRRHGMGSSVGAILKHTDNDVDEEEYDPRRPAIGSVASVVKVTERKSSVPVPLQANKSLLLRAMQQAEQSVAKARKQSSSTSGMTSHRSSSHQRLSSSSKSADQRLTIHTRVVSQPAAIYSKLEPGPNDTVAEQTDSEIDEDEDDEEEFDEELVEEPALNKVNVPASVAAVNPVMPNMMTSVSSGIVSRHLHSHATVSPSISTALSADILPHTSRVAVATDEELMKEGKAGGGGGSVEVMERDTDSDEDELRQLLLMQQGVMKHAEHHLEPPASPPASPSPVPPAPQHQAQPVMRRSGGSASPKFVVTLHDDDDDDHDSPDAMDDDDTAVIATNSIMATGIRNVVRVKPHTILAASRIARHTDDPLIAGSSKKAHGCERCKFWPACKNAEACPYHHPSVPCKTFPACRFGDACLFIHPNCKFDASCRNAQCPYTHSMPRRLMAQTSSSSLPTFVPPVRVPQRFPGPRTFNVPRGAAPIPRGNAPAKQPKCKFFPNCSDMNCPFLHPKPCRYGMGCANRNTTCQFSHPQFPDKTQFKWKAASKLDRSASM